MPPDAPIPSQQKKDTRFKPGQVANPRGKPPGTRNRVTLLAQQLMDQDAEDVIKAMIAAAKAGDITAGRLILERIAPLPRTRPVAFELPSITTAAETVQAIEAVLQAAGAGELTP